MALVHPCWILRLGACERVWVPMPEESSVPDSTTFTPTRPALTGPVTGPLDLAGARPTTRWCATATRAYPVGSTR